MHCRAKRVWVRYFARLCENYVDVNLKYMTGSCLKYRTGGSSSQRTEISA